MNLNDFYNEVARQADTETQKISAAETRRVLSVAFQVLLKLETGTTFDLIAKGLANAKGKTDAG
jgi:hypothetical protein